MRGVRRTKIGPMPVARYEPPRMPVTPPPVPDELALGPEEELDELEDEALLEDEELLDDYDEEEEDDDGED